MRQKRQHFLLALLCLKEKVNGKIYFNSMLNAFPTSHFCALSFSIICFLSITLNPTNTFAKSSNLSYRTDFPLTPTYSELAADQLNYNVFALPSAMQFQPNDILVKTKTENDKDAVCKFPMHAADFTCIIKYQREKSNAKPTVEQQLRQLKTNTIHRKKITEHNLCSKL